MVARLKNTDELASHAITALIVLGFLLLAFTALPHLAMFDYTVVLVPVAAEWILRRVIFRRRCREDTAFRNLLGTIGHASTLYGLGLVLTPVIGLGLARLVGVVLFLVGGVYPPLETWLVQLPLYLKRYDLAVGLMTLVMEGLPGKKNHATYAERAWMRFSAGDLRGAEDDYRMLIQLDLTKLLDDRAATKRGLPAEEMGVYAVIERYAGAPTQQTDHLGQHFALRGMIRQFQSDYEGALHDYELAQQVPVTPQGRREDDPLFCRQTYALYELQRYDEALAVIAPLHAKLPLVPEIAVAFAVTAYRTGQQATALTVWQGLVEQDASYAGWQRVALRHLRQETNALTTIKRLVHEHSQRAVPVNEGG